VDDEETSESVDAAASSVEEEAVGLSVESELILHLTCSGSQKW
jgi:hypothetical protein